MSIETTSTSDTPFVHQAPGELPGYVRAGEVRDVLSLLSSRSRSVQLSAFQRARAARVRALVRFLWLTGARISEALAVTVGDVDGHSCVVRVSTLKRRKAMQRAIPLPADYVAELGAVVRDGGRLGSHDRVFPWSRAQAFRLIREALEAAGVDSARAHPHCLRHGHAVHAVQSHVPLPVIQRVLGHSSVTTTSIYLEVTGQDVRRYYDEMAW